jgi:predicted small secreted protein
LTRINQGMIVAHHAPLHEGVATMRKYLSVARVLLALAGAAPLLGACHTTAGLGEDLSATGHAISNEAKKVTP